MNHLKKQREGEKVSEIDSEVETKEGKKLLNYFYLFTYMFKLINKFIYLCTYLFYFLH